MSPVMLDAFIRYPWPGNVRELENACERIAQTCICDAIVAGCVPAAILFHKAVARGVGPVRATAPPAIVDGPPPDPGGTSLYGRIHAVEVETITWALRASGGNKSKAAALLQVKRSTLGDRIKKLDLGHLESFDADSSQAAE